jgi:superfamily II DNA helicase RecQ
MLDPWLQATLEEYYGPDEEPSALILPASDGNDVVTTHDPEDISGQEITSARPLDCIPKPSDTELDICLETEVENLNGTASVIARVIPKEKVRQAQDIVLGARKKPESEQFAAICDAIPLLYPYGPRDGQRDALHHLIYLKNDLILIAKTSFGKSMILQAVSILQDKTISIVILPLNQIGKEQSRYIKQIGGRPCFLNKDTINNKVLVDIRNAKYTHILISPELAVGDQFRGVLSASTFSSKIALVVVDEAHLVAQWGQDFRTDYARLNLLRNILGREVPWFACSATLDSATLSEVIKGIGFDADIKIQRTSIDRPELLLRIGTIPKSTRNKFSGLHFAFDPDPSSTGDIVDPSDISKTIIFFDSKDDVRKACEKLRYYLQNHPRYRYSKQKACDVVQQFHRDTHEDDKDRIVLELQKLGKESVLRIVLATEALGIGTNLPDIRRVIQYGFPTSLAPAVLWQRGGRACRDSQLGEIILLVDHWVKGDRAIPTSEEKASLSKDMEDIPQDSDKEVENRKAKKSEKIPDTQRRGRLPEFWYQFVNDPGCLRTKILDYFSEPDEYRHDKKKDRCCCNCDRSYYLDGLDDARYYLYNERGSISGKRQKAISKDIHHWAKTQHSDPTGDGSFRRNVDSFLSQTQRNRLAAYPFEVIQLRELPDIIGPWKHLDTHGVALLNARAVSRAAHLPKAKQAPVDQHSQSQRVTKDRQMSEVSWPLTRTPSASQSLPVPSTQTIGASNPIPSWAELPANDTPIRSASQSDLTPSQDLPYTPLPELSMSVQTMSSNASPGPVTPATPIASKINRKRRPLGDISGNVPRKRARQVDKMDSVAGK